MTMLNRNYHTEIHSHRHHTVGSISTVYTNFRAEFRSSASNSLQFDSISRDVKYRKEMSLQMSQLRFLARNFSISFVKIRQQSTVKCLIGSANRLNCRSKSLLNHQIKMSHLCDDGCEFNHCKTVLQISQKHGFIIYFSMIFDRI